jgi:hypothetical protein
MGSEVLPVLVLVLVLVAVLVHEQLDYEDEYEDEDEDEDGLWETKALEVQRCRPLALLALLERLCSCLPPSSAG